MLLRPALLLAVVAAAAAFGPTPTQLPGEDAKGVRSDVPYIKCAVCEALAVQAAAVTDKLRAAATKAKPLSEVAIMDALDRLVAPAREEGEWISTIDLVEDGTRLRVVAQGGPGKCGAECKTVAMAAADVLDSVDTDLAEALWAGRLQGEAAVVDWLCRTATDACRAAPPPLPPTRPPGEAFEPEDEQTAQMRRTMASLKDMGMSGTLYDRNSVLNELADDDDDDGGGPAAGAGGAPTAADFKHDDDALAADEEEEDAGLAPPSPASAAATAAVDRARIAAGLAAARAREGVAAAKGWWGRMAGGKTEL